MKSFATQSNSSWKSLSSVSKSGSKSLSTSTHSSSDQQDEQAISREDAANDAETAWGTIVGNVQKDASEGKPTAKSSNQIVQRKISKVPNAVVPRSGEAGSVPSGDVGNMQAIANSGIASAGSPFPHKEQIQSAFGRHSIDKFTAHTDSVARAAAKSISAEAYATGTAAAFETSTPDLHTAAHEAAHLVQQQGNIAPKNNVGYTNDKYERHADEVAEKVVSGQSAESLLDKYAASSANHPSQATQASAVQRKFKNHKGETISSGMDDKIAAAADYICDNNFGVDEKEYENERKNTVLRVLKLAADGPGTEKWESVSRTAIRSAEYEVQRLSKQRSNDQASQGSHRQNNRGKNWNRNLAALDAHMMMSPPSTVASSPIFDSVSINLNAINSGVTFTQEDVSQNNDSTGDKKKKTLKDVHQPFTDAQREAWENGTWEDDWPAIWTGLKTGAQEATSELREIAEYMSKAGLRGKGMKKVATVSNPPLKKEKRSKEKVRENNGIWPNLTDVARDTVAYDDIHDLKYASEHLKLKTGWLNNDNKSMPIRKYREKDRFFNVDNNPLQNHENLVSSEEVGYRDIQYNITTKSDHVVELQLTTKAMLEAKKIGHALYNITREKPGTTREYKNTKKRKSEINHLNKAIDVISHLKDPKIYRHLESKPDQIVITLTEIVDSIRKNKEIYITIDRKQIASDAQRIIYYEKGEMEHMQQNSTRAPSLYSQQPSQLGQTSMHSMNSLMSESFIDINKEQQRQEKKKKKLKDEKQEES